MGREGGEWGGREELNRMESYRLWYGVWILFQGGWGVLEGF